MKILQVIPYLYTGWVGGNPPVEPVYGLSKALVERNHQVTLYTTGAFSEAGKSAHRTASFYTEEGINVHGFRSICHKLGTKYHIIISPAMIPSMAKQTAIFDIIHLHEYRTFQNIVVHHYAKKYGVPYLLQAHGSLPRIMSKKKLKQVYDNLWGYRLLKDAYKLIAVSPMEAEQYRSVGVSEDKIEIVPNGIDLPVFDNLPDRGEFRRKYGLGDDQRIILYLGRIHKIKGLDLLARAFADLSQALNDVKLVITGPDRGYLPSLKKLITGLEISDKVLFTGPLYGHEKLTAYVDADVYVLPSGYEIFGVTVLEACACGVPLIMTDRCGIAEEIGGQAGLVVPYDEEQLSNAMLRLLSDDKMRIQFGEKGKLLVREKFNWEKIAEQVERVYREIL